MDNHCYSSPTIILFVRISLSYLFSLLPSLSLAQSLSASLHSKAIDYYCIAKNLSVACTHTVSTFTCSKKFEFLIYRIMTCVGPDHLSEYTCCSENRITGRSMADSVTLGGAVALSTKSHIRLTSIYFCNLFEKIRVSRLSAVHKLQYIQLLHLGQHEPGLLVRQEVRRC